MLEVLDGEARYVPEHLTKDAGIPLRRGTRFRQRTPGGGGYGDPLLRDPAAVAADVRGEYITPAQAADDYGVVLRPGTLEVDEPATAARREALRKGRSA